MIASPLRRVARFLAGLLRDSRGASAVEFAVTLPFMILIFFGTVEVSNGVAVDRKVTIVARTLSDLTSQATKVTSCDLAGIFNAGSSILMPYYVANDFKAKISQIQIDASGNATISWSVASNDTARTAGSVVTTLPAALKVAGTNLIWSEVTYNYTPPIGHDMANKWAPSLLGLSESFYTRPRQSSSVTYSNASCP